MKRFLLMNVALVLCIFSAYAQDRTLTGTVTSGEDDNSPLPGVNVLIKGTSQGTITDIDGNFKLNAPEGAQALVFSYVGFLNQEVEIGSQSNFNVVLMPDDEVLQEVIVVGYGTQSESVTLQSVSKVSKEQFENQPIVNPQELIQGRAAGVQMVGTSGVIGSQANIRIRGVASISAGGEPLFVIDGVPLNDASGSTGYSNDQGAVALNPLQDLNPNDIEDISVLKDAAAVAIYGSRGANGVIMITTKKGKAGKTKINADYYKGWSEPTSLISMMNAEQYKTFVNDYRVAQGLAPNNYPEGGFDWPGAVVQTGSVDNFNISASGGNESTKFYMGMTYMKNKAFTIGNSLDKLNGRINLNHDISKRVRIGLNTAISYLDNDRINSDNSTFAPLTSSYLQFPYVQPYNEDGTFTNTGFIANVLAIEALSTRKLISRRTTGNIFAEIDIAEGLMFKTDWGIDGVQTEETIRDPEIVSPGGYGYKRIIQDNKWLTTNTLNYNKSFGVHTVDVLVGASFETSNRNNMAVEGSGFVSDKLPNVGSAATPSLTSATGTQWALSSQFSRVNYRYKDKYIVEGSLRRDGSSRFGMDNKWGTFWALSAGWRLSEEDFIKNLDFFDQLKLTASYGTAGNDRVDNFASLGLYEGGVDSDYAGIAGIRPTQAANPLLGWEESSQVDIGLSTAILNSRLSVDFNYYVKTTDGMLFDVPLPYTTGFASISQNIGKMENRGVDLMINGDIIQGNDFSWTANLNMGFVKNKVLSLPENTSPEGDFLEGSASQRAIVGHSVNTFYLIRYSGINSETGDAEWLTRDGEITNSPTASDRVIVGSAIPDLTGGFSNTLKYKGFDLNIFFTFVQGNKVFRGGRRFTENMGSSFNKSTELLDYWTQPGDNSFAPALSSSTAPIFAQRSTLQLEDGSYVRLRNLTLGYNLPSSILGKTKILSRARIYAMAQNLLTFAKTDLEPELNGNGTDNQIQGEGFFTPPMPKTITLGVSLGF
ncbi:SusC/RagA family TonB-linked outer membrane protein [Flexithrix dorotheae]|uniref:SusC/RagA family TonB-linked outer membrane protein n=1 Tax=Flexithrix dorotheae TaxID=70993 RepID=UPI0003A9382C|nr:TonB-dependent receptor [Flexithrix dorotheae]